MLFIRCWLIVWLNLSGNFVSVVEKFVFCGL